MFIQWPPTYFPLEPRGEGPRPRSLGRFGIAGIRTRTGSDVCSVVINCATPAPQLLTNYIHPLSLSGGPRGIRHIHQIRSLTIFTGAGVAQLVTTLQKSLPVRVRFPAIPKRPWLRGRGPSPRARWFQWKICRGPLDEQKIPRGGARVVQLGLPFPNLYRCNKVLVNQKKKKKKC